MNTLHRTVTSCKPWNEHRDIVDRADRIHRIDRESVVDRVDLVDKIDRFMGQKYRINKEIYIRPLK